MTDFETKCVRVTSRLPLGFGVCGVFPSFLVLLCFLMAIVQGQAGEAGRQVVPNPQELAARYEQTGHKHEAAVLYEDLVRTNPVARKVLAPRLVTIYTETG